MTDLTDLVKQRLDDYVYEAIGGYVTTNWNTVVTRAKDQPFASIKFEPITWEDETYVSTSKSAWAYLTFSIVISYEVDRQTDLQHPMNYDAMDKADLVLTKLIEKMEDDTEQTTYKINNITDLHIEDGGWDKKARAGKRYQYIVKGVIKAEWTD